MLICSQPWELMWKTAGVLSWNLGPAQLQGQAGVRQGCPVFCSRQGGAMPGRQQLSPWLWRLTGLSPWARGLSHFPRTNPRVLESQQHWEVGVVIPLVLQIWKHDRGKRLSGQRCSERMRRRLGRPRSVGAGGGRDTQRSSRSDCRWCLGGGLLDR